MEIHRHPVPFRQIEDLRHMRHRIAVGIGAAAQQIGALAQRGMQQIQRLRLLRQPLLREGAKFEVDHIGIIGAQPRQRVKGPQPGAGIHLDKAAHHQRAMAHGAFQQGGGAGIDIFLGEGGLGGGGQPHGLGQRALADRAAVKDQRLVQMDVAVHEARAGQIAAAVAPRQIVL